MIPFELNDLQFALLILLNVFHVSFSGLFRQNKFTRRLVGPATKSVLISAMKYITHAG